MHTKAHTKKKSNKNPNAHLSESTDGDYKQSSEKEERRE
jgi:hypothetical protein